ncbi:MAG: YhbY family RNA-binding protein [Clostridia bacterium]|jgi:RNA-binding protein|nr:YhbY family RNA-binding protein [Clostridia bacterium]MBQ1942718.1 YhbY family RNA-binding protein [Clostridia bacterium]MBQ5802017.1 YhbY family RNA-binding protein [Clostridia bacterium]
MTSKQRKVLQAIANNIEPITQIGKGGISENLVQSLSDALEKRELIKVSVLQNAEGSARELGNELAALLGGECVIAIGRKIVLYRRSSRKDIDHIEF